MKPCQDISVAGKAAGINGKRSGLWSEFARIIGEIRPRFVVIENVPALKTRGLDVVLADLAARGYDAEWQCIPASAFGAFHRRDRIWIVAYPNSEQLREQSRWGSRTHRQTTVQLGVPSETRQAAADAASKRLQRRQESQATRGTHTFAARGGFPERLNAWKSEPELVRVVHGVPNRIHRTKSIGNALVPQIAEWIAERIMNVYQSAN